MIKLMLAASAAVSLAASASAITVVTSVNGPDTGIPVGQSLITDFNTPAGLSGNYQLVTGSISGQYAAPLGNATQYLAVLGGNTATLTLPRALRSLSFYWGSIDEYNTVSFFNGGDLVSSFTGAQIPPAPADGSQGDPFNNRRVNFNFGGQSVTSVAFNSSANSFELDTVTGAVPEPQTWALLVFGFGMVGATMRRRKYVNSVVS